VGCGLKPGEGLSTRIEWGPRRWETAWNAVLRFVYSLRVWSGRATVEPVANGVAERWVRNIRNELLDHLIVLSESHLRRLAQDYLRYYHHDRTHDGLIKDTPAKRPTLHRNGGKWLNSTPPSAVFTIYILGPKLHDGYMKFKRPTAIAQSRAGHEPNMAVQDSEAVKRPGTQMLTSGYCTWKFCSSLAQMIQSLSVFVSRALVPHCRVKRIRRSVRCARRNAHAPHDPNDPGFSQHRQHRCSKRLTSLGGTPNCFSRRLLT
jgi:hypothetical protein